jgi:hypothetical protein
MFKYQLHKLTKGKKEARAVLLEDILTSDVFGLMAYLPYEFMLRSFLSKVRVKNSGSHFKVPFNEPTRFDFWPSYSWPTDLPVLNRDSIEPDAVIEWDDSLIIVEAKFISPTDPEELLREYLIGHHAAGEKENVCLLLMDRNLSQPVVSYPLKEEKVSIESYLQQRMQELGLSNRKSYKSIDTSFMWCNWQSFYKLVSEKMATISVIENPSNNKLIKNLLNDILQVMDRKGLTPFVPLNAREFIRFVISVERLGYLGRMIRSSLIDFSDFHIDMKCLEAFEFLRP